MTKDLDLSMRQLVLDYGLDGVISSFVRCMPLELAESYRPYEEHVLCAYVMDAWNNYLRALTWMKADDNPQA